MFEASFNERSVELEARTDIHTKAATQCPFYKGLKLLDKPKNVKKFR